MVNSVQAKLIPLVLLIILIHTITLPAEIDLTALVFSKTQFPSSHTRSMSNPIRDRMKGALFGMFVGDAVAMPVHWIYNLRDLTRDYGVIRGYVAPKEKLRNSILSLSNTGGAGRGSSEGDIIGTVINHGKKKYWVKGGGYHYHVTLQAGENTLEAQLARVLLKDILQHGFFSPTTFVNSYVQFMMSPNSHNDTYASSCHRIFFANMLDGKPLSECPGNDNHNVDTIDALTLSTPLIVLLLDLDNVSQLDIAMNPNTTPPPPPSRAVQEQVFHLMQSTRRTQSVQPYLEVYTTLLTQVLVGGASVLLPAIEAAGHSLFGNDYSVKAQIAAAEQDHAADPMVACYIDSSFPALLFYAYKYGESLEAGVLGSANGGGENVARGSLLGALLGAAYGFEQGVPLWAKTGLHEGEQILQEIDRFLELVLSSKH